MPAPLYWWSFDALVSYPLADLIDDVIHPTGITPNQITIINLCFRVVMLLVHGLGLDINFLWLFYLALFTTALLDCLDGHRARKRKMCSKMGEQLEVINDQTFWAGMVLVYCWRLWTIWFLICVMPLLVFFIGVIPALKGQATWMNKLEALIVDNHVPFVILLAAFLDSRSVG